MKVCVEIEVTREQGKELTCECVGYGKMKPKPEVRQQLAELGLLQITLRGSYVTKIGRAVYTALTEAGDL